MRQMGDVPSVLDQFQCVLDDYDEAAGDTGIKELTKKANMMQLLPVALKTATRDTLMAARTTVKEVSPDYLATVVCQRCQFDEAATGSAIPMDAGPVADGLVVDDNGSMGARGIGPGLEKAARLRPQMLPRGGCRLEAL